MKFFQVASPSYNQNAPGFKQAIFAIFRKNMLELVLTKIVFLVSDGASVNCCKDSRLIRLIAGGFYLDFFYLMFQPSTKVDT